MKIKAEDIDKIVEILLNKKAELKPDEYFIFDDYKLEKIKNYKLPDKWCIRMNGAVFEYVNRKKIFHDITQQYAIGAYFGFKNGTYFGDWASNDCEVITLEQLKEVYGE